MKDLIYKYNGRLFINKDLLPVEAKNALTCNELYKAIYGEFIGASVNPLYKNLTILERIQKVNDFAHEWLKQRGLE